MKLLILGASGRTGKELIHQVRALDIPTHIITRNPLRIEGVKEYCGMANDPILLKNALDGVTHVIQCLNISRVNDFPWSPLRTPPDFLSSTMQLLLNLSKKTGVVRIVCCSAWGVNESFKNLPFWFKWLVRYSNLGPAYKDHGLQEKMLKNQEIPYSIVRPVILTNGKLNTAINLSEQPKLTISRASLAFFLLQELTHTGNRTVTISSTFQL